MFRLLTAVLLFASFHAVAEVTLTDINNNEVADAEVVMGNFNALKQGVEANATRINSMAPIPGLDCNTDKIIKWDGSAWVCAADPLANLGSCKNGEALVYVDGSVTCDCNPPGTVITDSNFTSAITDWLANGDASQYGDIAKWCTGSVTDMGHAFASEHTFNADISGWDTSNVTNMNSMFEQAWEFNQDLSSWDASSVSSCLDFAFAAYAWAAAYDSIAGKTPPLSASLIAAGCGE